MELSEKYQSDLFEGVLYRHYKEPTGCFGTENLPQKTRLNIYYSHFVAKHSETEEQLVVYQSAELLEDGDIGLLNNQVWCRPLEHFCSTVEVEGKKVLRFTPM